MSGQLPWDLSLARSLVGHAARKAPPGLAERLEEEWLADLAVRQGAFSRIRFGLGCCWATRIIAREFGAAAAAATGGSSSASGERLLVGYGGFDFSGFSRRTTAIIVIVFLHAGIFYLYLTGITHANAVSAPDTKGYFIFRPHELIPPTPLLPPRITRTIVDDVPVPLPLPRFPAGPTAIMPRPLQPAVPAQVSPARPVDREMGGPGVGFPNTGDYYPPAARRGDEAGSSVVSVCVDAGGRLTAAPTLVASSGFGLLDGGALRLARAGSGHYRPTTENGRPVSSCYAFRITFRLEDQ